MKDKKEKDVADKKAKADKEKKKPEVIAKSLIVLDVKTWGDGNEDDEEEECEDDEDVEEGAEPKEAKPTKPVKEVTPEEVENRKKISQKHYEDLANKIMTIEKDGLFWKKEFKIEEVAFGAKKVVIGCVIEDEKISIDDIADIIQSWDDVVQSVDIAVFSKI